MDIIIIFIAGRVAMKVVPGKSTGLIMEMSSFKRPSLKVVLKQTWARTKSLIYIVFPIYIVGSALIQLAFAYDVLKHISNVKEQMTVWWLGLSSHGGSAAPLLGKIRKEFVLVGAAAITGNRRFTRGLYPCAAGRDGARGNALHTMRIHHGTAG